MNEFGEFRIAPGAVGRVIRAYTSGYTRDYVTFQAGEAVTVEWQDTDWPGWLWCAGADGRAAWVAKALLEDRDGLTVLREDYTNHELEVQPGDRLALHRLVSGWYWAEDAQGQAGWVPAECVEVISS